jgi:hypothetical protein
MFDLLENISDLFSNIINYNTVNSFSILRLRNSKISLSSSILFRFLYSKNETTHQNIVSKINDDNNTNFSRQAYIEKEKNIPVSFYEYLLNTISSFYNNYLNTINDVSDYEYIAIDGVYNTCCDRKPMLNIGIFNVTNNVPIDITYEGNNNRNKEVKCFTQYIKDKILTNIDKFSNVIFVADRGYHSYEFLNFLIDNNLKFIIRVKGTGDNLNPRKKLLKNTPNYDLINRIRNHVRVIKSKKTFKQTVNSSSSKKENKDVSIKIKSDYVLITNLKDKLDFPNKLIIDKYKSRWDIEVFFKHIKYNFKFQNLNEKDINQHKKLYICEIIIMYIAKMIEKEYNRNNKELFEVSSNIMYYKSINKKNLIDGIYNKLLPKILNRNNRNITDLSLDTYIKIQTNKYDRSFARKSKTPFTKWYIKGYSEMTKFSKIINAIEEGKINNLNKNLKVLASKIELNYK